jgi:phage terminase large subunit
LIPGTLQIPTARVFLPLLAPSRYKGAYGGRGSAKSHFFAGHAVERCLEAPARVICIREHQRSLKQSSKRLIEDKITDYKVGSAFNVTVDRIDAPNGGLILFEGMQNHTAESIKSLEGFDIAWIEEASALSQRSLDLLRPTIRKLGSEIWASWNPNSPEDPIDKLFRGPDKPPNAVVVKANYTDNPWFPEVLREEMEWDRRRDPDKYKHVWGGGYAARSEARVFKNWRIDTIDIPRHARPYFGADWGFSVDPTVMVRCWIWDRVLYIDREVYKIGCEIDRTPALFDEINDPIVPNVRQWPILADSARPETISYMQRNGFPKLVAARKGPGSIEDGVEFIKNYDVIISPDCPHTSDEFSLFSFKIDKHTDEVLPILEDKKNHTIDSVRYAVENVRKPQAPTAATGTFQTAG